LVGDWKVTLNGLQLHEIMVETMVDELLQCLEGTSVSATKPLLWIRSSSGRRRGQLGYPARLPKGRKSLPPASGASSIRPSETCFMLTGIDCMKSIMPSGNGAACQRRRTGENA